MNDLNSLARQALTERNRRAVLDEQARQAEAEAERDRKRAALTTRIIQAFAPTPVTGSTRLRALYDDPGLEVELKVEGHPASAKAGSLRLTDADTNESLLVIVPKASSVQTWTVGQTTMRTDRIWDFILVWVAEVRRLEPLAIAPPELALKQLPVEQHAQGDGVEAAALRAALGVRRRFGYDDSPATSLQAVDQAPPYVVRSIPVPSDAPAGDSQ